MRDRIATGWLVLALEELTEAPKKDIVDGPFGSDLKASSYVAAGVPIVRLQNIDRNKFIDKNIRFVTVEKAAALARHSFRTGDIIVTKLGDPVGKACIVPPVISEGIIVADVVRARIDPCVADARFVAYAINSAQVTAQLNLEVKGSTRPRVNLRHIRGLKIPLAPIAEQRRIVAKLEKLFDKVDSCQRRLAKTPILLKRFRQAVLAAACSGRLTADWRDENHANLQAAVPPDLESMFGDEPSLTEIPEAWVWVRFHSVIRELRNGISPRPRIDPPGTPILRISAVRPGRVDLTDIRYLEDSREFLSKFSLANDDLLFTRYNGSIELLGVCGMVRGLSNRTVLYPDKLMRVRVQHDLVLPGYVELFFQAPDVHERVIAKSKSSAGQNGVSGSDIKAQPLALPFLPEQEEIVRRVDQLFSLADQVEARYAKAKEYVDGLKQSILGKAFRGELVPQDPNDEPATVLLERIREARARQPANRSRVKANKAKSSPTQHPPEVSLL